MGLAALKPLAARAGYGSAASATSDPTANDIEILNGALFYEHQAVWAYGFAAGALSDSDVGKAVLAIALANQEDHAAHRNTLTQVVRDLGGMPVMAQSEYDLSSYLERGEGALNSDVNIAKLALALETDAAIAYGQEVARLQTPELVTAGVSIATAEAAHATTIRAAFVALGVEIPYVPAAYVSGATRDAWILTV
jgi:rubrerythrin